MAAVNIHIRRVYVSGSCAGGELFEHIGKRAAFTEAAAAEVARSLLQYLAHVHGLGVTHMDIKPENIMFDSQGATGVLKVGSRAVAHSRAG
jgi:serine/threonine protein kinase